MQLDADSTTLCAHLQQLEERLLQPETRHNVLEVASLLADDFREFGSSGRSYSKPDILQALAAEGPRRLTLTSFQCQFLAADAVLVTYRSTSMQGAEPSVEALRSSVWVRRDGQWRMVFHQGTRVAPPDP